MLPGMNGNRWLAVLAAVFTCLGTVLGTIVGSTTETKTTTRTVVNTSAAATPKQVAKAPPAGELQSSPAEIKELRDSTPAGVSPEQLQKGRHVEAAIVDQRNVPPANQPIPQGGAQGYSCRVSYASGGFGAYRSHFTMFDLHYTVSSGRGWAVLYNMKRYLESVGLSATFIMDLDGRCLQTVRLDRNPYTQGAFNVYGVSVEIIATGKEPTSVWMASPLIKDGHLAALVRDTLKSHNLPVRFVDPVGCTPQAGYTDHNHLECGNNHVDVSPFFPWTFFNRQVQAAPKPVCGKRCHRVRELRAKHQRTHRRLVKNHCAPKKHGYCDTLRSRNRAVHRAAKAGKVSLAGTYR